jgi:hypothetical protein
VIAVDGKVVRGSRTKTATAIHLLAAMEHHGVVLAQRQVASKSNEIPSFEPLPDTLLDLENDVLTTDALHTQHGHGTTVTRTAGSRLPCSSTLTTPAPARRSKSCAGGAR